MQMQPDRLARRVKAPLMERRLSPSSPATTVAFRKPCAGLESLSFYEGFGLAERRRPPLCRESTRPTARRTKSVRFT
jgi:hypothetical protein